MDGSKLCNQRVRIELSNGGRDRRRGRRSSDRGRGRRSRSGSSPVSFIRQFLLALLSGARMYCNFRDEVTMTKQHIGNMVHHKGQNTQWKLIILVNQSGNSSSTVELLPIREARI